MLQQYTEQDRGFYSSGKYISLTIFYIVFTGVSNKTSKEEAIYNKEKLRAIYNKLKTFFNFIVEVKVIIKYSI